MNAGRTARERVRAELTREITGIARRQLATEGAAGLSLRAVARELGMVSSAIYRYFPSRDDLLTVLIIEGYTALAEAVEAADAPRPREDHVGRWRAIAHALRDWALGHPHEYALLYGSPVPGYHAPADTVGPASRIAVTYGRVIADAYAAGALRPPEICPPPPEAVRADLARVREAVLPGVPDDVVVRALSAWTNLFGTVSFELFGQFTNVLLDPAPHYEHLVTCLGRYVGLPT
jgi:AcrR family transcriptional regulator